MYLKKSKRPGGRVYLSICKNFRDAAGKNRTQTYQKVGYVDELLERYEDPIAHFEGEVQKLNKLYSDEHSNIKLDFSRRGKLAKGFHRRNVGYFVLSHYYQALEIDSFWRHLKHQGKIPDDLDINAIFRMMIRKQIFSEEPQYNSRSDEERWFDSHTILPEQYMQAVPIFASCAGELMEWLKERILQKELSDTTHLYYDIANCEFELSQAIDPMFQAQRHKTDVLKQQVEIVMDKNGVPLSYHFASRSSGNYCINLTKRLKETKSRYKPKQITLIKDQVAKPNDYVLASILSNNNYILPSPTRISSAEFISQINQGNYQKEGDFCFESHCIDHSLLAASSKENIHVAAKQLLFWRKEDMENLTAPKGGDGGSHSLEIGSIITNETTRTDTEILEVYRHFWRMHKSAGCVRPKLGPEYTSLSNETLMQAFFLVSYVAITLLRLLQVDTDWKYSASTIANELRHLNCSYLKDNWWHFDYRNDITDDLCSAANIDFSMEVQSLAQIKKMLADARKKAQ